MTGKSVKVADRSCQVGFQPSMENCIGLLPDIEISLRFRMMYRVLWRMYMMPNMVIM